MGSISTLFNNSVSANQSLFQLINSSNQNAGASPAAASGSDQTSLSPLSQLFQQLTQLQTSNPTQFKQLASEAATDLTNAAQQATDPNQAKFLDNLASKFQDASQTGNLSAFDPQSTSATQGHHHHHHHGGGGGSSTQSTDSTDTTDPLLAALTDTSSTSGSSTGSSS